MRFTSLVPLLFVFTACGDDGGGGGGTPDAPANIPAMVNIAGKAVEKSAMADKPLTGVMLAAYRNSDPNTPVVMGTTDANGMYSLSIPTEGKPLDGFVKATYSGLLDTYLYPPKPLSEDFGGASIYMVSSGTLDLLSTVVCRSQQDLAKGLVAVLVTDTANAPVAGVKLSSSPAGTKDCYNMGGTPNPNATVTDVDGIGYLLNVPAGDVMVDASKSGSTFNGHKVNARAGTLTTTVIQ